MIIRQTSGKLKRVRALKKVRRRTWKQNLGGMGRRIHGMGRGRALSLLEHVGVAAVRNLLRQGLG